MAQRLLTTFVAIIVLTLVMITNNNIIFGVAAVVIALIALNELFGAFKKKNVKPIEWIGYLSCLILLLIGNVDARTITIVIGMMIPIILFISFIKSITSNVNTNALDIAATIFSVVYVVYLIGFLVFTKQMNNGNYYVWYIFGGAWMTDGIAYLVGSKFGKHKFSKVSKNKSIEGSIGGILGAVLFFVLYSVYLNSLNIDGVTLNLFLMGILGAVVSIVSQVGDFAASTIKRYCDIKDFGTIMPGHGGILDRFDSVLFIAPVVYLFFSII